jgi:hypothetical protein
MNTLRKRLKHANAMHKNHPFSTIAYDIVCDLNDQFTIESERTLCDARQTISDINEEYKRIDGRGIKLYIIPVVIHSETGEVIH